MKSTILCAITVLCITLSVQAQQNNKDYVQLSDPVEQTDEYRVFGSLFNEETNTVKLDSLITQSKVFDDKMVTTKGTIEQVCQKKGCFFILKSSNGDRQARISFKDYSFFIPTNTAGSVVKLNGTFDVKTISEEDAKHYAKDAGEDPDAINGPQKEYSLVATSVVIYK